MQRPNIVLIMADQLAPHFLPSYGHPVVHAPHLARLAAPQDRAGAASGGLQPARRHVHGRGVPAGTHAASLPPSVRQRDAHASLRGRVMVL